jgi:hemoglobin
VLKKQLDSPRRKLFLLKLLAFEFYKKIYFMHTLFDKYGGTETMRGLVREFYKYARASPKVGHFFDKLNMEKLIDHQVQFLSFILGRPARIYKGRELADAHQPLNISDEDFNEIGRLLKKTLTSAGVADEDVSLIMGVVIGVRDEIVNHAKPTPPPLSSAPANNPTSEKVQADQHGKYRNNSKAKTIF